MSYQIGDLEFNATVYDIDGKLHTFNIFGSSKVKQAICQYKLGKIDTDDLCFYLFNTYWSRCEYEMVLSSWPEGAKQYKADVYSLYIKPNFPMLLSMIDKVSVSSCREWRRNNRARV